MAKITRKTQKVFGGSLTATNNIAKFGSLKIGAAAYSLDPDDIQTSEYDNGLAASLINNNAPTLQDLNSLFFLLSRQIAYQMQTGVPEYDAGTTYYIGSLVNDGNGVIYKSLTDANVGNALSDATKWNYNRSLTPAGVITPFAGAVASPPTGWAVCDGSTLSRATYADLFARIGTAWDTCTNPLTGAANTAPAGTLFRLPDLRDTFLRGAGGPNAASVTTTLAGYQADKTKPNGLAGTAAAQTGTAAGQTLGTTTINAVNSGAQASIGGSGSGANTNFDGVTPVGRTGGSAIGVNIAHNHAASDVTLSASSVSFTGDAETRPQNVGVNYIIKLYDDIM
jgi:hypothetical protein